MSQPSTRSTRTWVALVMIVVGVALVLGSIFADALGATWGGDGYGWKQLMDKI
ncbi:MAG: hypothetical protein M3Y37_05815 [Chloroflexota bacterium]|nr:hypothetical protein [Chloroflexota bacterium]